MHNLTLIIPAKKESESLPIFLRELDNYDYKKLIVLESDDFETKNSLLKFRGIEVLEQKKKGYGNAIIEGINYVTTEYVCIINADGSMDPKYIHKKLLISKNYDLIFSSRYHDISSGSDDDDAITFLGNKIFTFLGNILFNLNISDILYTYILGKTNSLKSLNLIYEDFRICVEIPIKSKLLNYRYTCVNSFEKRRIGGKKKVNAFNDGFLILSAIFQMFLQKFFK